ncbi:Carboxylesterase NlhH [Cercospora beticola]|uniref:Carboxylesterase NlhH n=1 Tax=Cercospora beticola TaxID=122368 RepID=A0A2G5IC06_CERBT|nr:Carboxylesterase NlhH [Cercospora beticola]PIB02358.1 Carboxylesterase NlhH [Cercospora beticola]WPA95664.1 hypothetical protein RHO25_000267 [Cercospora beticola]CAK1356096.1 unnamed protein product [Cercospora beticola]
MCFQLNPDVGAALAAMAGPNAPPPISVGDVDTRRVVLDAIFRKASATLEPIKGVDVKDIHIEAQDGHKLLARWYTSTTHPAPGSAVLYSHGGGYIALSLEVYDHIIKNYVANTGVPILAVEYRLAPEVRAPVPVQDVYTGLQYLHTNATSLGIDPNRIAVMGDSAGGGLSAALAHYNKVQPQPLPIKKQILIYPMLDDTNTDPSSRIHTSIAPFLLWKMDDNITAWGALLGRQTSASDSIPTTHAPARSTVEEAQGLPPAYIDVGELDLFREEDLQYASLLGRAGVSCEFHLVPGVPHAFETVAPGSEVAKRVMARRFAVLKEL